MGKGFMKTSVDIVGTVRASGYLPEPLKTKAIGVFFILASIVDFEFCAAHVRSKKVMGAVCGGNAAEIELILSCLEKLNLITWARSSHAWVLVVNPLARHKYLGSEEGVHNNLEDALQVYKEAKTCGELSQMHYGMINRFIDENTVGALPKSTFEES